MKAKDTTTTYRWSAGSAIAQVDLRVQHNGQTVAYIYADPAAEDYSKLREIRAAIRLKGWGTLSDHRDGKFGLRVSGIHNDDEALIGLLSEHGWATGTPQITTTVPNAEKSKSLTEYVRSHSLTISGSIATVGNLMSIASGFARGKEIGQIGQGAAFALADLPLAVAGGRDDSRQLTNLLRQLKKHYDKTGIEIPKNASIEVETSDRGKSAGELTKDYLHRYANQIKCSLEVVAAGFTIHAGRNQGSSWKKNTPFIWGSGFLASLLIPEKKIDDEKYAEANMLSKGWMLVQSNPLAIGGLLGYSNTVATFKSAGNERRVQEANRAAGQPFTQHYRWDYAIPSVMIGANGTYAISKKSAGGDIRNDALVGDVYSIAAQIINKQPDAKREAALESTAQFLGERTEIKDKHQQIIERLKQEIDIQRQNPWFENVALAKSKAKTHRAEDATQMPTNAVLKDGLELHAKGLAAEPMMAANAR